MSILEIPVLIVVVIIGILGMDYLGKNRYRW